MNNKLPSLIVLTAAVSISQYTFAESGSNFPTHCNSDEVPYLNARMGKVEYDDKGRPANTKNGKILSICADQGKEPFNKVVYRYGQIGKVEMEEIASRTNKFSIFNRATSPHTGENIFFFSKGPYTYYVTEATAQGAGIALAVFKSGKKITDLFSGTGYGSDFEAGLIRINFYEAESPIFIKKEPPDQF